MNKIIIILSVAIILLTQTGCDEKRKQELDGPVSNHKVSSRQQKEQWTGRIICNLPNFLHATKQEMLAWAPDQLLRYEFTNEREAKFWRLSDGSELIAHYNLDKESDFELAYIMLLTGSSKWIIKDEIQMKQAVGFDDEHWEITKNPRYGDKQYLHQTLFEIDKYPSLLRNLKTGEVYGCDISLNSLGFYCIQIELPRGD